MTNAETLTMTTPSDREVQVTRVFKAPRQMVFKALTTPDVLKRWMHGPDGWTLALCEMDLRVGGAFRYVWKKANGGEMGMGGVFREIAPPERIVHTELFDEDWTGGETVVTTTLTEHGATTTLTLTILYASKAARDQALETNFAAGMEAAYRALDDLLASPARA
ncbi:MAG: SRPBCC domain-containing protein [Vicinamibacteraceae bacterium]